MDPYRQPAELVLTPEKHKDKIMFIYGSRVEYCPLCNYYIGRNGAEFCTPFRRVIFKRHLFKPNLVCNLKSVHYHCWCLNDKCKTHWIVDTGKTVEVYEI